MRACSWASAWARACAACRASFQSFAPAGGRAHDSLGARVRVPHLLPQLVAAGVVVEAAMDERAPGQLLVDVPAQQLAVPSFDRTMYSPFPRPQVALCGACLPAHPCLRHDLHSRDQ